MNVTLNKHLCITDGQRYWVFYDELNLEPTLKQLMFERLNMRQTILVVVITYLQHAKSHSEHYINSFNSHNNLRK